MKIMLHTIIGINGTTGQEIAKNLTKQGEKVRGISRRLHAGAWEHVAADVLNGDQLTRAVAGSAVVYACFGLPYSTKIWRRDWENAIENVINACLATDAKLVFLDNNYMYGPVAGIQTEATPMNPTVEKGKIRKIVAEKLLHAFAHRNLRGCIARAANFYGPDCPNSVISDSVVGNALKGKTIQWVGDSSKFHSLTYTPDIGRACVILGKSDKSDGQVWHLPTAKPMRGQEFVDLVAKIAQVPPKHMQLKGFMWTAISWFIPILGELREMRYQFESDYLFSSEKYETTFQDFPTSYEDGFKTTIDWYKNQI